MLNISSEADTASYSSFQQIFTALVLLFIFLVGVPGNALVLWVTGVKIKRRVSTIWFCNLALSDIICCSLVPFVLGNHFTASWPYGKTICKILPFTILFNMFSSIFTLVAISIDRCILVVRPVWAKNHRRLRTGWLICLVIWVASIVLGLPSSIYRTTVDENNRTLCIYMKEFMVPITITRMVFGFLIPLIVISTCYILLALKVQHTRLSKASRKTTRVALGLIVAFFISWAPYHILGVLMLYSEDEWVVALNDPAQSLGYFSSCINPILYIFMGKDMKSTVRRPLLKLIEHAFS